MDQASALATPCKGSLATGFLLILLSCVLSAVTEIQGYFSDDAQVLARSSAMPDRIREGTRLTDQPGHFRLTGDRLTFFPADSERRLEGLENLALERIAKIVEESSQPLEWRISGEVTEYQGTNYLLVTRAVLKSKAPQRSGK